MCTNNYKLENKHRLHHVPGQKVDYCTTLYNNSYHNLSSVEPTLQFNDKSAVKSLISKDSFIKSLSSILSLATTEGLLKSILCDLDN